MDQRDTPTWVAIELSRLGEEKVQEGSLEQLLRADLRVGDDLQIFIPAATYPRGSRRVTVLLMEGYAFVAAGLPEVRYFELERKPYVVKVMSAPSGGNRIRTLHTVPNKTVEDLRQQLRKMITSDMPLGTQVRVLDGTYKNLEGVVQGSDEENAFVEIRLRSLEMVATIPRVLLEVQDSVAGKKEAV